MSSRNCIFFLLDLSEQWFVSQVALWSTHPRQVGLNRCVQWQGAIPTGQLLFNRCRSPTVNRLCVVSLRVVEPIRPLVYLHPPTGTDTKSVPRRSCFFYRHPQMNVNEWWKEAAQYKWLKWACTYRLRAVLRLESSLLAAVSHAWLLPSSLEAHDHSPQAWCVQAYRNS